MKRCLVLTLACLVLAHAVAGAQKSPNKVGGRKLMASASAARRLPNNSSGRKLMAAPAPATEVPDSAQVTTFRSYDPATCYVFDEDILYWDEPRGAKEWEASGSAVPPADQLEPIYAQMCDDTEAAGEAMRDAIFAGGAEAQAWAYAVFHVPDGCDPYAGDDTFQVAIDLVNDGDPEGLEQTKEWVGKLVEALDAVGIPMCVSVALVDPEAGEVLEQTSYHTGA